MGRNNTTQTLWERLALGVLGRNVPLDMATARAVRQVPFVCADLSVLSLSPQLYPLYPC